jgi:solute:Na+ symporter, SSS family
VPSLAAADWLIVLIYCFFALAAGFSLRPAMTASRHYLQAGRALPGWLCGMALAGASLGSQEVLGMGAAGARYGLESVAFFALGSIPAMLFAGLYMMPVYYGTKSGSRAISGPRALSGPRAMSGPRLVSGKQAPSGPETRGAPRSIPEYLGLRFDQKTRALSACLFLGMAAFSAGIALYAMARVFAALHIFDRVSNALNLPPVGILLLAIALPAALVLAYVLLGGLAAAMYNQAMQFCVLVGGLLPTVLLGLEKIGGWRGLKAAVPASLLLHAPGAAEGTAHPMGIGAIAVVIGVGLVLGGGTWCTDFRLLQTAMAARDVETARRVPLIAAALRVFAPLVLILPGLIAVGLPTPRTTIVVRNENGTIYHEITVVPAAIEAGQGLVPAKADAATGKPIMGADGHAVLDYAMATPNVLLQFLPMGLLGLGVAALLACLMSGVAASLTAFSMVFTCDIFPWFLKKGASDKRMLAVGRWAVTGGMFLALAAACAALRFNNMLDAMMLVFAVVNAPLFAALLLGAFWKRATGHGAFAGLIAGAVLALLHHGLSLPIGAQRGMHGGWIAVLHHPASQMGFDLATAGAAFVVSLIVTAVVSAFTRARAEEELKALVHSLIEREARSQPWWKRPETPAAAILLAAIAVSLIFI